MASSRKRWMLTEDNLRRLQPSLIQPMAPVSISSGDDDDVVIAAENNEDPAVDAVIAREAPAARVARLRTWVYNAMLTLVGLGDEGVAVLAADELYIAGPGDVRLRANVQRHNTRLKGEGGDDDFDEEEVEDDDETSRQGPDLSDPAYWQAKLRYLEAKCRPLSQERRKRRRLAPPSQIAAEDAACAEAEARAAEGRGFGCGYNATSYQHQHKQAEVLSEEQRQRQREERQAREEARAERARIEQSKLLWRDKRSSIERWVQALPIPPVAPKTPSFWEATGGVPVPPYGGLGGPAFDSKNISSSAQYPHLAAALSDSSIVEITPAQFSSIQTPQTQETEKAHRPPVQQPQTLTINNMISTEGQPGLHVPHIVSAGTESTAPTAQPMQRQHSAAHAMADASLDLSAVTKDTAPPTAATPVTLAMDTPHTSASPGEVSPGDDVLAPGGSAAWPTSHKRGSHGGHQSTAAAPGKRRRIGTDTDNVDGGRT
ncbi:hypothetical protein Sste5346_007935 [Sporothrix stenoceras]|uniref:Uncharacterized protein n=1 Tax=Sporothrix stenoceras TaxID=5173 RepID=A0ABR3YSV7_9PEZI